MLASATWRGDARATCSRAGSPGSRSCARRGLAPPRPAAPARVAPLGAQLRAACARAAPAHPRRAAARARTVIAVASVTDTIDEELESGRHEDAPFTLADWRRHRSTQRHWAALLSAPRSHVFRSAAVPAAIGMLVLASLGTYDELRPEAWPSPPHVSVGLLSLAAGSLSLLIVFRTNSSYGRWDEARRLCGVLVNRCRDVNRSVAASTCAPKAGAAVARWCAALGHTLRLHLRSDAPWSRAAPPAPLPALLGARELDALAAAPHRPLYCMQVITQLVRDGGADPPTLRSVDEDLKSMEDAVGGCERLLRTPIPLSYTKLTSRFLAMWLLLLPFTLWAEMRWEGLLFSPLLTFLLYGVDEVAVELEEPFSILPLSVFAARIEAEAAYLQRSAPGVRSLVEAQLRDEADAAAAGSGNNGGNGAGKAAA